MKNIFLTLALLLTVSFAFAGNGEKDKIIYSSPDGIVTSVILSDNNISTEKLEALRCTTHCPDGTEYSCWLCKCSSLPSCSSGGNTAPE